MFKSPMMYSVNITLLYNICSTVYFTKGLVRNIWCCLQSIWFGKKSAVLSTVNNVWQELSSPPPHHPSPPIIRALHTLQKKCSLHNMQFTTPYTMQSAQCTMATTQQSLQTVCTLHNILLAPLFLPLDIITPAISSSHIRLNTRLLAGWTTPLDGLTLFSHQCKDNFMKNLKPSLNCEEGIKTLLIQTKYT